MSTATWITGDVLDVLAAMPENSVDLVLTSSPFLALRDYLEDSDPAKDQEIGQESTPGEFIDTILDVTEALRRVLAPHGSMCWELGDTYAGSGGAGGDYNADGLRDGQQAFSGSAAKRRRDGIDDGGRPPRTNRPRSQAIADGKTSRPRRRSVGPDPRYAQRGEQAMGSGAGGPWPEDKSLVLVPELFRIALAYGFNPLTGRTTQRWRVRNVVRWVRPNPPVGALGDKFRPGTSDMVVATGIDEAGRRRYFDLDAVRTPSDYDRPNLRGKGSRPGGRPPGQRENTADHTSNPAGAPPLDWWKISPSGYPGSHYATWPPELCVRPIEAMCPRRVCTTCGQPSRRIVETEPSPHTGGDRERDRQGRGRIADARNGERMVMAATGETHMGIERRSTTVGWTDCGHDTWRTGIVLDPFGGSGTTLAVATGHGRDAIGIDLDHRNADLARQRIGPMFFTEATTDELWPQDGAA